MDYHQQLCEHYKNVRARLQKAATQKPIELPKPHIETPENEPKKLSIYIPWTDHKMEIVKETAAKYNVGVREIFSHAKRTNTMLARREICWRLKRERNLSYSAIGRFLNKDHTTIIHAVRNYEKGLAV